MKNKKLAISSLVMLLPVIAGVLLWGKLPESMPVHFNLAGEADGFASKYTAVLVMPLLLLALHLFLIFMVNHDPKKKNVSGKVESLVYWMCPIVSLFVSFGIMAFSLGYDIKMNAVCFAFVGIIFIIIGNYLPKCQQNYTVGIKLPWTLNDKENWRKTHRMAGPLWIVGGIVILISAYFGKMGQYIFLAVLLAMVIIPAAYSFSLYKKKA